MSLEYAMVSNTGAELFFIYTASLALITAGCGKYLPVQPNWEMPTVAAFSYGVPILILPFYLISYRIASRLTDWHAWTCIILSGISIGLLLFRFAAFIWRHV